MRTPNSVKLALSGSLVLLFLAFTGNTQAIAAELRSPLANSVSHYTKGLMNDLLGLTGEAIEEYKKAAEYDNKSYIIHLRLGANYARVGKFPEAIQELKLVSEFKPQDLQSRYLLALIYSTQKNFDLAAEQYETILKFLSNNDPENLEVHTFLGQLYYSQGKYDKAVEQFSRIYELDPENLDNLYILGSLYIEQGARSKAIGIFQQGIELDPNHDGILNSLAYMYAEEGTNLDEASDLINRALGFEPENGAYLDTLGWIYYQKGMYLEALDVLKKADKLLQDPVIYDHLGDVYFKLEELDEAKFYWSQSLKLLPAQEHIQQKIMQLDARQAKTNSDIQSGNN